ncbi:hypothetical protein LZ906_007915 [Paraclostridium ghonii]|uniref:hypothetical protein n=1 Tax=Paraclostridium ghonii TaxID=29358 RepID=UPI00202CCCF2|nr:hypothetical protein [Paeniclostridium ghonii]MCM0167681.1 hypothetical protein [Paeniclostridium ghonii]
MFTIDFTKPWLYKDIVYFKQGNLSTNNTLRCKVIIGGLDDLTDCDVICTFKTNNSKEISQAGRVVDGKGLIIDIVFPSNALVLGVNELEMLINSTAGGVAQSPAIKYEIWKGITTGNGIQGESNYPILIQLINTTNEALNNANNALNNANTVINKLPYINASIEESIKATANANIATENSKITAEKLKKDFNALEASKQQDAEVIKARDGEVSLQDRLERDLAKGKLVEETKEGTYLSFNDTVGGIVSYLELQGNTVQDVSRLQDIKSVGIPNDDGTFKMSILSCGINLCNNKFKFGEIDDASGQEISYDGNTISSEFSRVYGGSVVIIQSYDNTSTYARMFEYDKTFKIVTSYSISALGTTSKTLNTNTEYIKLKYQGKQSNVKAQLEYGNVSTQYTPYEETRADIKLPCQLDKWDRLYFDKGENAWCVDKGTQKISFKLSNYEKNYGNATARMTHPTDAENGKGKMFIEGFSELSNVADWQLPQSINKFSNKDISPSWIDLILDKTVYDTIDKAKAFEGKMVYYKSTTPQKIVLPKSEQVKLNSFANKTHIYTIAGEVDATVKATVSKSLASTVQANTNEINNLSDRISDIEGLKESQDFEYWTDKGYLVCKDTKNGVVKDLKICGKTLVNIWGNKPSDFSFNSGTTFDSLTQSVKLTTNNNRFYNFMCKNKQLLKPNKEYTFIVNVIKNEITNGSIKIESEGKESAFNKFFTIQAGQTGTFITKMTTLLDLSNSDILGIRSYIDDVGMSTGLKIELQIVIIEGDHTQNPPSYFEGIASVGNGDKIEVLSTNSNLFDGELRVAHLEGGTNIYRENAVNTLSAIIKIPSGGTYYCKCEGANRNSVGYFKDNPKPGDSPLKVGVDTITVNDSGYLVFYITNQSNVVYPKNIMVNFGSIAKLYIPHKQDKKPILFKDTDEQWKPVKELRGIDLTNCDTIEKHSDNKHYLHVRTGKTIINSSKGFTLSKPNGFTKTVQFWNVGDSLLPNARKGTKICICDKLKHSLVTTIDEEFFTIGTYAFVIGIDINKANSLETLDSYLKANPYTFIYQLAEEQIFEVNPLDLESFEHETMISIDGGVVAPYVSWKITSYLPNFVRNLSSQVRQLQDQVYKTNVANFTVALNTLDTKLRLNKLESPNN